MYQPSNSLTSLPASPWMSGSEARRLDRMDIRLVKTAKGLPIWFFRCALQGGEGVLVCSSSQPGEWVKRGSHHTAWAVPPLSYCFCSYSYRQGTAVGPPTGKRSWPLLSGLWRAIAPLMKPWCAEGRCTDYCKPLPLPGE